jgi:hypothetical protein
MGCYDLFSLGCRDLVGVELFIYDTKPSIPTLVYFIVTCLYVQNDCCSLSALARPKIAKEPLAGFEPATSRCQLAGEGRRSLTS